MTNYEIDTRVPMIICTPETKGKNSQSLALVEFVDIYPTLCELVGLEIPRNLEGLSTIPLLKNPQLPWKKAVFSQFLRKGIWVAPDGVEYMGYSIRTNRRRYVEWINWETKQFAARELYDRGFISVLHKAGFPNGLQLLLPYANHIYSRTITTNSRPARNL